MLSQRISCLISLPSGLPSQMMKKNPRTTVACNFGIEIYTCLLQIRAKPSEKESAKSDTEPNCTLLEEQMQKKRSLPLDNLRPRETRD